MLAGVAGLLAGSFSMAVGEYVSVRSQRELLDYQDELQRRQLRQEPAEERAILVDIYRSRGLSRAEADLIVGRLMADPEQALDASVRDEIGLSAETMGSPVTAAVGSMLAFERQGASRTELRYALADTVSGMVFSGVVAYFIILASGATLFVSGQHTIGTATDAAIALRPVAGDLSAALLAIGLIGAGVLAVPILTTSAASGVSEAAGWKFGLDRKVSRAPQFYAIVIAATVVGMVINFLGINPITALVITAVINGLLAAPLLVLVMLVSNNPKVMGERANSRRLNVLGWGTTAVMAIAAIALVVITIAG